MTASTNAEYPAHDHVCVGAAHDRNDQRTRWVVALTAVMMVGEIIAGYVTGSMALLADGLHMATPAGAFSVAAVAYSSATRHPFDRRFSFGPGKVGVSAGFASWMGSALCRDRVWKSVYIHEVAHSLQKQN